MGTQGSTPLKIWIMTWICTKFHLLRYQILAPNCIWRVFRLFNWVPVQSVNMEKTGLPHILQPSHRGAIKTLWLKSLNTDSVLTLRGKVCLDSYRSCPYFLSWVCRVSADGSLFVSSSRSSAFAGPSVSAHIVPCLLLGAERASADLLTVFTIIMQSEKVTADYTHTNGIRPDW